MNTFEECAATYGDVVRVSFAGFQQVMVFHPDYVRQILIDQPEKVTKSRLQQRLLGIFHGNSLTNSDGEFWKRQRKLMQPTFHTKRIQSYMETMASHTTETIDRWQIGETYDMFSEMVNLTLSIVGATLFGTDITNTADRVNKAIRTLQDYVMRKAPAMVPLPIWVPLPYHKRTQQAIEELRTVVTELIEQRRKAKEDRGDLLSMLLLSMDEEGDVGGGQMSDIQARDEAISMLIVGHVTTSAALSWAFSEIGQHPEVEAKLIEELDTVLGGSAPTMQDMRQLKYLDMVVKETLRLHPPSWAMPRDVVEDIEVGDYLIPKGTGLLFCEHVMQRDARWFPEPNRFMPERFAEGWENNVPKCAYMPFGIGAHNCIGQIFATMEIQMILAIIYQRYKMTLAPGQEIVSSAMMTQRPRDGVRMQVGARQALAQTA
jgi:cytochrome P450